MATKREEQQMKYNAVRDFLCEQHRDDPDKIPMCFTSKNGKCPLAKRFCYECKSVAELIQITPPNGRKRVKRALNELAKEYGIGVKN